MKGDRTGQVQFEISKDNERAYRDWIRSYRFILGASLVLILGVGLFFGLAIADSSTAHSRLASVGVLPIVGAYVAVALLCGLLAYGAFWIYGRGPTQLTISVDGLLFDFKNGRMIRVRWADPGFSLRLSRIGFKNLADPGSQSTRVEVQSLRYPHIELNEPVLDVILSTARAMNLEVKESRTIWPDERYWDRIVIRNRSKSM
jgi:hypothetical protein